MTEADLIIGTSAGSTAAAQITSATPTEVLADILSAMPQPRTAPAGSDGGRVRIGPAADHVERTSRIIAAAEDSTDMRRRMGAAALEMDAGGSHPTDRYTAVAVRLAVTTPVIQTLSARVLLAGSFISRRQPMINPTANLTRYNRQS
jgi:NTE family protein